ncbi:MAG TPA: zinc-binding alcohol dehydrogenase family protein [Anaerolineae bacterium]|nr:zinc-binding alcohol dehydrogenase family protein [Anaerolineae bacterium]
MKAMVLREPKPAEENPLSLTDLPLPAPRPGQVRLQVQVCGVCHTDLHLVEGEIALPKLPVVPGHQIVGLVDALGPGVDRFAPGERLGVPWLYSTCGRCDYCQRGLENLCDAAQFTGQHADGGFAEYMVVPADFAYPIPEGFPDEQAAPLLCAGIIGYRSLKLSEIEPGGRLGLYGFGASAHVTIQVARYWGCEVYVFTRSEEHQRHALELGAAWVGQAQDTPPVQLDSAITFAPVGWLVPEALRVLRKGGTLAINAIHLSPIPELPYPLLYGERTVRSVTNATRRDAQEFLQLAAAIPIRTDVELYALEEANAVLQRLKRREVQGAAVLRIEGGRIA